MKSKVKIIAAANNFHFIDPLIPALSETFDIKKIESDLNLVSDSDLIWLEWADGICIEILKQINSFPALLNKKIILRLHRYELFSDRTIKALSHLSQDVINRIDKIVFVSKMVQEIGIDKFPWMENSVVIPNLIDHTKFPFYNREKGFNILMLGRMSYVKNLPLALMAFYELLQFNNNYKLHIVGNISDPELIYYSVNFLEKTKIEKNVIFHGIIENEKLSEFMKNMHYILSSSIFESQGMGILEAMCCGLKPAIFNFPGADLIFPKDSNWLWTTINQFIDRFLNSHYFPFAYHSFILDKFSIVENIYLYKNLIYNILNNEMSKKKI